MTKDCLLKFENQNGQIKMQILKKSENEEACLETTQKDMYDTLESFDKGQKDFENLTTS